MGDPTTRTSTDLRATLTRYAVAVACIIVGTVLRMLMHPYLHDQVPFVTFFIAVMFSAWYGGLGPGLMAVALSILSAVWFVLRAEGSLLPDEVSDWAAIAMFTLFGVATAFAGEWMWRSAERYRHERQRFYVTLASIGDGVIVTDTQARVTFLNAVAEQLTGWSQAEANGQPLETVFRIVNEASHAATENPVERVLREGKIVGLANHTILIDRRDRKRAIDDSAAPIRADDESIVGVVLVFRDVTEQRRAVLARGRLAALVESSDDAIIGQSFDGVVTSWNRGAERLFGFSAEEAVGKPIESTIVPPDRAAELHQRRQRVQTGQRVEQFESVRQRKDGRHFPVFIGLSPILDDEGTVIGVSAIDRDISGRIALERRRAARLEVNQILAQEENLERATPQILSAVCQALEWDVGCLWMCDPRENVLRCAEVWQRPDRELDVFTAATRERTFRPDDNLPGRVWKQRRAIWIPDVVQDADFQRRDEAIAVGLHGAFACPVIVEQEFLGVIEFFSQQNQSPDDDLLEMIATLGGQIAQFIQRKMAERARRESDARFRLMADSAPVLIWLSDTAARRHYFNRPWLEFTGTSLAQEVGDGWLAHVHPDDAERTRKEFLAAVEKAQPFEVEYRLRNTKGEYRWLLDRGIPLRGGNGELTGFIGSCIDLTDRMQMEDALREADRRKDEFLAMLAHELRNPLAPIRTGLEILAMEETGRHDAIELMQQQVEHLVRLVDDLLDVSRIMRGRVELRKETVELQRIVQRSAQSVRSTVGERRQELSVSVPDEPIWLDADPVRLVQIVDNLLNNASKYTDPEGRVELDVQRQGGDVSIRVRDSGVGIEPELLPKVFDLFTQSSRSLDRSQGGLGIGLTLVRSLVELHGGRITAHSDGPGRGSEFVVQLRAVDPPTTTEEATLQNSTIAGRRILIVDDNVGAARMLALLLSKMGEHQIAVVGDGRAALQRADEMRPEIVLLDIGLPRMNGYEVARRLRQRPEFEHTLLVALTGYGQESDRRRSQEAGFDEHLVKPPAAEQLCRLLSHVKLSLDADGGT